MKLSLAITTYLRYQLTIDSFAQVIDDPRIDDIVLLDDCSPDMSFQKLTAYFKGHKKVRVIRQAFNRGMQRNKFDAVAHSKNDWVILFDSDNVLKKGYLDALEKQELHDNIIYMPDYARPQFDYRKFAGKLFDKSNAHFLVNDTMGNCLLNTCNYTVHRATYMEVFSENPEIKGSDTLWFNYLWLKAGYSFYVVPGMQYFHLQHNGSTWLQHADYNMKTATELNKKILSL